MIKVIVDCFGGDHSPEENGKGSLEALKQYKGMLPENIILLDDVYTTGSTLESCSLVLKEVGINYITGITLFQVD